MNNVNKVVILHQRVLAYAAESKYREQNIENARALDDTVRANQSDGYDIGDVHVDSYVVGDSREAGVQFTVITITFIKRRLT